MKIDSVRNILLLDYCSEKNRGDAAIQAGLTELVREGFPGADIRIMSVFGSNQKEDIGNEYDHSRKLGIPLLGALRPTFYPVGNGSSRSALASELLNLSFSWLSLILLLFSFAGMPSGAILSLLPKDFRASWSALREADLVVWRGRNFRDRKNAFVETYRIFNLVFHPLICIALRKKIACVGVSVWNLRGFFSAGMLRFVFSRCFFISVREELSLDNMKRLFDDRIMAKAFLLPDLSFAAFRNMVPAPETGVSGGIGKRPAQIGLTLMDWRSEGRKARENYMMEMAGCLKHLINEGAKIYLIPQNLKKWESCEGLCREIRHLSCSSKDDLTLLPGEPDIYELLDIYRELDLLIATRLHSAIFASVAGTPVIAVSYDSGGKWGVLKRLGLGDYMSSYSDIKAEDLLNKIDAVRKERDEIAGRTGSAVAECLSQVGLNISIMKRRLGGHEE